MTPGAGPSPPFIRRVETHRFLGAQPLSANVLRFYCKFCSLGSLGSFLGSTGTLEVFLKYWSLIMYWRGRLLTGPCVDWARARLASVWLLAGLLAPRGGGHLGRLSPFAGWIARRLGSLGRGLAGRGLPRRFSPWGGLIAAAAVELGAGAVPRNAAADPRPSLAHSCRRACSAPGFGAAPKPMSRPAGGR